jgi:flagellar hook capping protein FlgD
MFPHFDDRHHTARKAGCLAAFVALFVAWGAPLANRDATCPGALTSAAEIQAAMLNATPGTTLYLAPGVYVGSKSKSGDPGAKGCFYSGVSGQSSAPIVIRSCDPTNPAVLSGSSVSDGSYVLHLTGDWWEVRDVVITNAQKGVVIDDGDRNLLSGVDIHQIGQEGVHFRDGSSYNALLDSRIYDTGNYTAGFGEGVYVGSDYAASYEHNVVGNVIRNTRFDGDISAEHIEIKEGADGTVVEYCTFNGAGVTGANSADSFIDAKGVNSVIRYNRGSRNGNANLKDAFQVSTHGSGYPTGRDNRFYGNSVNLDDATGHLVNARSGTVNTTAYDDVRIGGGPLYTSNVIVLSTLSTLGQTPKFPLGIVIVPNPMGGGVRFAVDVDSAGEGVIQIFDVASRRIAEIARGPFEAGRHTYDWDGRDAGGERAGHGVYFVRMAVNERVVAQRFTLIR